MLLNCTKRLGEHDEPGQAWCACRARVVSVEPLRVAAADGEEAVVNGVPERFRQWMEDADLLQGTWRSGEFDAAGWIPKEVLGPSLSD